MNDRRLAAALTATAALIATTDAASAQTVDCGQLVANIVRRNAESTAVMANGAPVPVAPWSAPTPVARPSATPTATPSPVATPTPSASPTPSTVFGPSTPVVQPVPTPTPTPTPTPVAVPTTTPVATGGSSARYLTSPNGSRTRVVVKDGVTYYVGTYTAGYGHQDVSATKSYAAPTVAPAGASVRTIAGQRISVVNGATTAGLSSRMTGIIDELHLTAAALGLAKPVITSATDGEHTTNSIHGKGMAMDVRCQSQGPCTGWAMTLKQALGPGYDVMWESNPRGGNHLHVEYDGRTA